MGMPCLTIIASNVYWWILSDQIYIFQMLTWFQNQMYLEIHSNKKSYENQGVSVLVPLLDKVMARNKDTLKCMSVICVQRSHAIKLECISFHKLCSVDVSVCIMTRTHPLPSNEKVNLTIIYDSKYACQNTTSHFYPLRPSRIRQCKQPFKFTLNDFP